jgi:hypothetical protein
MMSTLEETPVRVHIPTLRRAGEPYEETWVGRKYKRPPYDLPASPWQNPFTVEEYGLDESLRLYEKHVRSSEELMSQVPDLAGRRIGDFCKPGKPCHTDVLIKLFEEHVSTLEETRPRVAIREFARQREGYDASLYDRWEEWNGEFFGERLTPPLIQLAEPSQTHCYGDCAPRSGLAGIRSRIRLRPSILRGTPLGLKGGNGHPEGCRRFLEDVLLHEMVHQYHQEITGENDSSYSGHGPAFSATVNEISPKLGLPTVGKTCKKRDHSERGLASPSYWPHDVRNPDHYLGAFVPSSTDKPTDEERLGGEVSRLVGHFGFTKVLKTLEDLQGA